MAKVLGFEPRLTVLETVVLAVKHYTDVECRTGFEPVSQGFAGPRLTHWTNGTMVIPLGFEPRTYRLKARCSTY